MGHRVQRRGLSVIYPILFNAKGRGTLPYVGIKKGLGLKKPFFLSDECPFQPLGIAFGLHHRQLSFHLLQTERATEIKVKVESDRILSGAEGRNIPSASVGLATPTLSIGEPWLNQMQIQCCCLVNRKARIHIVIYC